MLTFGSLFSGIGGFDLGFERAGMQCKWQVEIDDYATRVLAKHWLHVTRYRDIRDVGKHNLERVDVICGGFPCQDISYAGKGAGLDGERSGLFFELMRVVGEMGPRVVVLENVAALLTRGLDRVLGTLASFGFDAEWHCIPAASFGAPHFRRRLFIVAYANGIRWPSIKAKAGVTAKELQSKICNVADWGRTGKLERNDRGRVRLLPESDTWRMANGISNRMDRLRGLGNAVVPQVAEFVGNMVTRRLQDRSGMTE